MMQFLYINFQATDSKLWVQLEKSLFYFLEFQDFLCQYCKGRIVLNIQSAFLGVLDWKCYHLHKSKFSTFILFGGLWTTHVSYYWEIRQNTLYHLRVNILDHYAHHLQIFRRKYNLDRLLSFRFLVQFSASPWIPLCTLFNFVVKFLKLCNYPWRSLWKRRHWRGIKHLSLPSWSLLRDLCKSHKEVRQFNQYFFIRFVRMVSFFACLMADSISR